MLLLDIDECANLTAIDCYRTEQRCINTDGSYRCVCADGYYSRTPGVNCAGQAIEQSSRFMIVTCFLIDLVTNIKLSICYELPVLIYGLLSCKTIYVRVYDEVIVVTVVVSHSVTPVVVCILF